MKLILSFGGNMSLFDKFKIHTQNTQNTQKNNKFINIANIADIANDTKKVKKDSPLRFDLKCRRCFDWKPSSSSKKSSGICKRTQEVKAHNTYCIHYSDTAGGAYEH